MAVHHVTDNDYYTFVIEEFGTDEGPRLLAHLSFKQVTPSAYKRVLRDWSIFRKCCAAPLFAYAGTNDVETWVKFVSRLGFEPTDGEIVCSNGAKRRLYLHTKALPDVFCIPVADHQYKH